MYTPIRRFQYVNCQFETLRNLSSPALIRKALRSLPKGLDNTYDRILQRIAPETQQQVSRSLRWLAFSIEVLKLEELSEIFVVHPEQAIPIKMEERLFRPEDVLRNFSGLVTTKAVGAGGETACTRVSLVHFSVKEYLVSSRISKGPASFFAFSEADAHTHIAHSCLEYLIYTSSPDGMMIDSEFIMRSYARKYWPQHLEMVPRGLWTAQVTDAIM